MNRLMMIVLVLASLVAMAAEAPAQVSTPPNPPDAEDCAWKLLHQMEYTSCEWCEIQFDCATLTCWNDDECLFDAATAYVACIYTYDCGGYARPYWIDPFIEHGIISSELGEVLAALVEGEAMDQEDALRWAQTVGAP